MIRGTIVMASLFLLLASPAAAEEQKLVAKVNGQGISQVDFDRVWKSYLQRRGLPSGHEGAENSEFAELRKELLDDIINYEVLWQAAQKEKMLADNQVVEAEIAKFKETLKTKEAYDKALQEQEMTEEHLRREITKGMSVQKYLDETLFKALAVSDDDVHAFYSGNPDKFTMPEQVCASHILVRVDDKAEAAVREEARKKIDGILKEIKGGADFAERAKAVSDCPSKDKGGDLGCFGRGRMVKPFEEAAFALQTGALSEVVETQFGYHIIKLTGRKPGGPIPESQVADKIRDFLLREKSGKALEEKVQALRKAAVVEILNP